MRATWAWPSATTCRRGFLAFSALFGPISFELFDQYQGSLTDRAAHFDHQLGRLADPLGL